MNYYNCYSDVPLDGNCTAVASDGSLIPYVGTASLQIWRPGDETPTEYPILCDQSGNWTRTIYADKPGHWKTVVRVGSLLHGSSPDGGFLVRATAFPPSTV
jgi:hypothetical protein